MTRKLKSALGRRIKTRGVCVADRQRLPFVVKLASETLGQVLMIVAVNKSPYSYSVSTASQATKGLVWTVMNYNSSPIRVLHV